MNTPIEFLTSKYTFIDKETNLDHLLMTQVIWRLPKVMEVTGLKRSSIYNLMKPDGRWSDPSFPKCFKLSASKARNAAVGWWAMDIIAWVMSKRNA